MKTYFSGTQKSSILGVWTAPGAPKTLQKGSGQSLYNCVLYSRPPKYNSVIASPPYGYANSDVQGFCMLEGSCGVDVPDLAPTTRGSLRVLLVWL